MVHLKLTYMKLETIISFRIPRIEIQCKLIHTKHDYNEPSMRQFPPGYSGLFGVSMTFASPTITWSVRPFKEIRSFMTSRFPSYFRVQSTVTSVLESSGPVKTTLRDIFTLVGRSGRSKSDNTRSNIGSACCRISGMTEWSSLWWVGWMLLIYGEERVTFPSLSTEKSEGNHWKRLDTNWGLAPSNFGGLKTLAVSEPGTLPIVRP